MDMAKVLVTESLEQPCADWLAQHAEVSWANYEQAVELEQALPQADALVVRTYTIINEALLDRAPQLKVVGRAGVGLDNVNVEACRRRGVEVVYTPEANSQAVVEYTLALMLDDLRPRITITEPIDAAKFHHYRKHKLGTQLDQLTLGILGFGRIGKKLGRVAAALGMKLLVNDLLPESQLRQAVDYPFEFVDKPALYADSDIVTIHIDGRAANHHIVGAEALSQMKSDVLLVNAARGMLIDRDALATWAKKVAATGGRAVLDVHDQEPIPPDYPLYGISNVRLLPHTASRTATAMLNMGWVVRDIVTVLQGKTPKYPAPVAELG